MASRSRSRSPLNHDHDLLESGKSSPTPSQISLTSNNSGNNLSVKQARALAWHGSGKHCLKLYCVPLFWRWQDVAGYIKKHTNYVDKDIGAEMFITMKQNPSNKATQYCIIVFKTEQRKVQAYELLRKCTEKVNGKKLFVTDDNNAALRQPKEGVLPKFKRKIIQKPFERNDDNETYGLSFEYLKGLGISPPLTRKVFVRFLPLLFNDETKICSVFGKAGTISMLEIAEDRGTFINARILYDHPVEAVQAISMFNNRDFYGQTVKCAIDTHTWYNIEMMHGPGLGPNETPVRGVSFNVEVDKVRDEIMKECQSLNEMIDEMKSQVSTLLKATNRSWHDMETLTQTMENQVVNCLPDMMQPLPKEMIVDTLSTSQTQSMQLMQSVVQQNTANDLNAIRNALQNWTGSNSGNTWQQGQSNNQVQAGGNMHGGQNMQGGVNMQGGPNIQGGVNMQGGPNIQGGINMQGGSNVQGGVNMQGGPNVQGGVNMQGGPNIQGGVNMLAGPNIQGGINMQGGPNVQGVVNMQGGPNIQGGVNMQGGPNMQAVGNIMQGGPNMQSVGTIFQGSTNMQAVGYMSQGGPNMHAVSNMQSGPNLHNMAPMPFNMQSFPANNNMQSSNKHLPTNMQGGNCGNNIQSENFNLRMGPTNMHGGLPDIQPGHLGIQGQINNNIQYENFNLQMGPMNMHGGPPNIHPGYLAIQGQINNPGFYVPSNQQLPNMQYVFPSMPSPNLCSNQNINTVYMGPPFNS